eukprot:2044517-Rhodomonas_salina.2
MTDWSSLDIPQSQQVLHCFSLTVPRRRAPGQDGTTTASDAAALASEIWSIVQDCPAVEERDICLASLGLDPAMPWESMGIGVGFVNDGDEPPDDLNKIHPQTVRAMDEQIHKSSLGLNPAYSRMMEFLQDDPFLSMEDSQAFPHHTKFCDPILSPPSLLAMEHRQLCAPFHFWLVVRDDPSPSLLLPSAQIHRLWTLWSSYNWCVFEAWNMELKQQLESLAFRNQQFRHACNVIDTGGSAPTVTMYQLSELEPWTKHLDPPGRKRANLEGVLVAMSKDIQMASRAELRQARPLSPRRGVQLQIQHPRLRTLPAPAPFDSSTAGLPRFRIQDDMRLWSEALDSVTVHA